MEQAEIILHTTDSTGKVSDRFLTKFDTEQPPVWKGTILVFDMLDYIVVSEVQRCN